MVSRGIALHSVIPVRSEAREQSEQQTQMLFGETCVVLEQIPRWNRIKLDSDGQEGWVDSKMLTPMLEQEHIAYSALLSADKPLSRVMMPMAYAVSENNGQTIPLSAGTILPAYQNGRFEVLGVGFRIDPQMVAAEPLCMNQQTLLQAVRFFLNIPYLWGGKNALGMDCSGFTQVLMSLFGKSLLRNASEQANQGTLIASLAEAQPGDVAFFDHEEGRISHVGILLDTERIVHCSGRVKVEKIDESGIFSTELVSEDCPAGRYTHHLVSIRRF